VLRSTTVNLIGNGVVVDPVVLFGEMQELRERGVSITPENLKISDRAHMLLPYHQVLDLFRDAAPDQLKIGTTGKGIGPAYEWKVARRGIRFCEIRDMHRFCELLKNELALVATQFPHLANVEEIQAESVLEKLTPILEALRPFVVDGVAFMADQLENGKTVLFEGAQATLLDVDFGTYPFVTSSNASAAGVTTGAGVPHSALQCVIGVSKAYTTRVGEGPFPTELHGPLSEKIREAGAEYGTTTGRPRRCGWLDLVNLRYARQLNGLNALAVMKLDVLSGLDEILVCTHYLLGGRKISHFPASIADVEQVTPCYQTFPGWRQNVEGVRHFSDLPKPALAFLRFVEENVGCPVDLVSVGPDRSQTIFKEGGIFEKLSLPR